MAGIKKVYAYLRVSDKSQVDKGGFDRQLKAIKAFCDNQGYSVTDVYREKGVSGTKGELDRPTFQDMIKDILSNGIRTIVVESLDRLAREYVIQDQFLMYLARHDICLIASNTGEDVTEAVKSDPMKKAMIQIQAVFSELDKSQVVRKLQRGREKVKAEKGKCEGRKHYGEVSEEERKVLKRITYMRRKSKYQEKRMSFQKISDVLNNEGIKTILNKNWTATGVKNVCDKNWITRK